MQNFQLLKEKNIDLTNLMDKIRYCLSINGECQKCNSRKNSRCSAFYDTELLIKAIHRLYEENTELQKEIKRLKDDNCHDYHCMCLAQQENTEQKLEIERLKEELAEERVKDTDRFVSLLVLKQENTKLQKQVDELTEAIYKTESAANETYMLGFEEGEKHAIKDKAKETFVELLDFVKGWFEGVESNDFVVEFNRILKDLAKKCGIEVD